MAIPEHLADSNMDVLSLQSIEDCDWIRHQFGQAAFDTVQARHSAEVEGVAVSTLFEIADEVYAHDIQLLRESQQTCCQSSNVEVVSSTDSVETEDE